MTVAIGERESYETSQADVDVQDEKTKSNKSGSFSDSTLHHAIISPIPLDNLPLNIIEQLKQKDDMILPHNLSSIPPHFFNANYTQQQQQQEETTTETKAKSKTVLSPDEKRQRRLLRNRLAAKDCRKKKKEYIQNMEETIDRLEKEKLDLLSQVNDLKHQISLLPHKDQQVIIENEDNYRLMKEVEMLNAKLGSIK